MPYARNADLPEAVRDSLPPRAQKVFREAFNDATERGLPEERAFANAWGTIRNAGWHRQSDGRYVKKQAAVTTPSDEGDASGDLHLNQPSSADTHVKRPMSGKKPRKPREKASGEDEGKDEDEDEDRMAKAAFAVEVKKLDEDQNLVFGWLSVIEENGETVVDLQGHVIDEATLEAAAYDMVLNGCDAGEMHERIGIGAGLVECMVFTKTKQEALGIDLGKVGLWVGFKVDAEAFARVKSGELRSFSLGGRAMLEDMEDAA